MKVINELLYIFSESKARLPNVHFVFEGTNTEPFFIKRCLYHLKESLFGKVNILLSIKEADDFGRTEIKELLKIANDIVSNKDFVKGIDKVVVVFDLDRFKNDQSRINTLLNKTNENIIFAYTNPSFELFVFLLIKDSLEKQILPDAQNILENNWVFIDEKIKERYIFHSLKETIGLNVKNKNDLSSMDFETLFENFDYAEQQELRINRFLDKAANNLTSNICEVLTYIKNGLNGSISYEFKKKGE